MRPTSARLLAVIAVLAASIGWAAARIVDVYSGTSWPVPWSAPVTLVVLATALALWARGTRDRLAARPGTKPLQPLVAARSAALAMAASRVGALVAGFYAGVALELAPSWDVSYLRERVIIALLAVASGVLVVVAALWLERVCRLPPDSSDDDGTSTSA